MNHGLLGLRLGGGEGGAGNGERNGGGGEARAGNDLESRIVILPEIAPGRGRVAQASLACGKGYGAAAGKITSSRKKISVARAGARKSGTAQPIGPPSPRRADPEIAALVAFSAAVRFRVRRRALFPASERQGQKPQGDPGHDKAIGGAAAPSAVSGSPV